MRSFSIQRLLARYASGMDVSFQADGKDMNPLAVFAANAYLPLVAFSAESLAHDCLGWTLGARFAPSKDALFGVSVATLPVRANAVEGSILALVYLRAAVRCMEMEQGRRVDLFAIYEKLHVPLATYVQEQLQAHPTSTPAS